MNQKRATGRYVDCSVVGARYRAFVPNPLPPDPPLAFDTVLIASMERASRALGRLDGYGILDRLPNQNLFLYSYVRKEAVLSSQIEGTQSSLSDLLLFELDEAPGVPMSDVVEVSNYVAALNHGIERIRDGFPLCLRLFREMHEKLLSRGRGAAKQPGEFRTSQNWIGGSRPGNAAYVPPPPEQLDDCLARLEYFLHEQDSGLPTLIKAALAHVQFETIHPFLDGNGRLGRLLITLMLTVDGLLQQPLLYLSLYFKSHRAEYYEQLQRVRIHGDWEGWLVFFLDGVADIAQQAVETARILLQLFDNDRERIRPMGRIAATVLAAHEHLQNHPLTTIPEAAKATEINRTSITRAFDEMAEIGMVEEITGQKRNRIYAYREYLDILADGTDPLN
jgi:Fic family protein